MRLPAEQTSPWLMKTPNSAPSMAASKSASAKKMLGDLPPSSSVTRLMDVRGDFQNQLAHRGAAGEGDLVHLRDARPAARRRFRQIR